jgi:hypothetical protein
MGSKGTSGGIFKVSEQDNQLQPFDTAQGKPHMPENPTPQDFGFPDDANVAQMRCWANQERWLQAFSRTGSIGGACIETGISVPAVEAWDYRDVYGFKKRKAWAAQVALGDVEREIRRRAIEGVDKPVIYQGHITDTYKEYSDNLLMFRAKRLDPAYKDNYQPQPASTIVNITQTVIEVRDYRGSNPLPASEARSTDSIDAEVRELGETEHN